MYVRCAVWQSNRRLLCQTAQRTYQYRMYLSQLSLHEFRNYTQLDLSLGRGLFLFYGENAQGKTNLLEAVTLIATGNSFHAASDREVVNWRSPEHVARLRADVKRREDELQIEIMIFDPTPPHIPDDASAHIDASPQRSVEMPVTTPRKRIKINGLPKKTMDLIGQMKVVLFAPSDLHLVDGPPDERRRFMDRALCQVQPRYCQALVQYRKIVIQRAALLKRIRDNQEDPRMLDYLDDKMTSLANLIVYERQRMLAALNEQTGALQEMLSGGREHLQIVYRPSFKIDATWNPAETQKQFLEQLHEARRKEFHQGVCLLGPHRDDLEFLVNGVNMQPYGSRGQQRSAALSAKLAELAYMRSSTGDEPVLLLDDVFSELDPPRRAHLLREVFQHEQVFLTATELSSIPPDMLAQAHVYSVVGAEVTPMT
jgi:DNA replication and repair protein RecF